MAWFESGLPKAALARVHLIRAIAYREALPRFNSAFWKCRAEERAASVGRYYFGYEAGPLLNRLLNMVQSGLRMILFVRILASGRQAAVINSNEYFLESDQRQLTAFNSIHSKNAFAIGANSFRRILGRRHLLMLANRRQTLGALVSALAWAQLCRGLRLRWSRNLTAREGMMARFLDRGVLGWWEIELVACLLRTVEARVCYAGHFDAWIEVLTELHRHGHLRGLNLCQHGAIELPEAGWPMPRRVQCDQFVAAFPASIPWLQQNWVECGVEIISSSLRLNKCWQSPPAKRSAAFILQDPRIVAESRALEIFVDCCRAYGVEPLGYLHPRLGRRYRNMLSREHPELRIEEHNRHAGLLCYITRFSTLGLEYADAGEKVGFIRWAGSICALESGNYCQIFSEAELKYFIVQNVAL